MRKRISGLVLGGAGLLLALPGVSRAAQFNQGDLVVLQAAASASNTTASIVELAPTGAGQTPVQTVTIPGTGANGLRFSGSATSTGYLSHSDDRTLLLFTGANSADTSANVNTLNPRAVGTLDRATNYVLQTTYTGTSGNQTRAATTLNGVNFFVGDQGGIYTNGATTASPTGNFRGLKSFGGTIYTFTASTTTPPVGTFSSGTVTPLPGLANGTASLQDFYLVQSGNNGTAYDVLYVLSATSATVGAIDKYSLVSGSWAANGTYATTFGGFGLSAADLDPNNTTAGAALFASSGTGASTANSLMRLTDTAGFNTTINITTANNVSLYTAPTGAIIKGVDFAPVPEPTGLVPVAAMGLMLMKRRRKSGNQT